MTDAFVDFDGSNDHLRIDIGDGRRSESVALDSRLTSSGHTWTDTEWEGRIEMHLRWADNLAQIIGTYVRYNQLWCELRAKQIGAWHPRPTGIDESDAAYQKHLAKYGPLGTGECVLTGCDDPFYATAGGLRLCVEHFDQIKDIAP